MMSTMATINVIEKRIEMFNMFFIESFLTYHYRVLNSILNINMENMAKKL